MGIEKITGKVVSAAQQGVKKAPEVAAKAKTAIAGGKEKLAKSLDGLAAAAKAKLAKPAPEGLVNFVNGTKGTLKGDVKFDKIFSEIPTDKLKEGGAQFMHQGLQETVKKTDGEKLTKFAKEITGQSFKK